MLNLKLMEVMDVLGTIANNMPELPEVETIKNTLKELTLNKVIKSVDVLRAQTIDGNANLFASSLINKQIIGFERVGKFIIFDLSNDLRLISHLRMEGKYFLKDEKEKITKHDLVVFHFKDNTKLVYNDTRRFGRTKLSDSKKYLKEAPLSNVGPDPFMMENVDRLVKSFKNKTIAIKTALLDQSIMSGLGNIYVDEVLFETKIHPETSAKLITKKQLENILATSKIVLSKAVKAGGTTIKSYHPREGISGNFQVDLKVYGKKGKQCPNCGTELRKKFVNGRGTTYCPKCQKNIALPKVYGLTGPIASGKSTIAKAIEKCNFKIIDCDEIVHNLYKNKQIQKQILRIIPTSKILNGTIDRKSLKNVLISNPKKKAQLEKYIHGKVVEIVEKEINKSTSKILIEAPLLFESKLDQLCDEIIFVDVTKEKQIENLKARNSDVESSLELNKNFDAKLAKKKATIIITNDKDVANLNRQVQSICCK